MSGAEVATAVAKASLATTSTEGSITIIGLDKLTEDAVKGGKGGTGSTIAGGASVVTTAGASGGSAQGPGLGQSGSVVTTNTTIPPMSLQNPTTLAALDHNSNIHTTSGGVNAGEAALSTHSSSPGSSTSSSRARSKSTSLTGKE